MRIDLKAIGGGPGSRRRSGSPESSSVFSLEIAKDGSQPPRSPIAAESAGAVAGLICLQEDEKRPSLEPTSDQACEYGRDILAGLDELQRALILDDKAVSRASNRLRRCLSREGPIVEDEALQGVIREIEVRAQVEMAKLTHRNLTVQSPEDPS